MRYALSLGIFLFLVLEAMAIPNGEFLIGESTGEKFREMLTLNGSQATLMRVEEDGTPLETPIPMKVQWLGQSLCLLSSDPPEDAIRLYARFKSDNEAVVWYSGDHRLYWALSSVNEGLASLQGSWEVLSDGTPMCGSFEGKTLTMTRHGLTAGLALSPVWAESWGTFRVVARPPAGASFLLSFIPLTPDLWLVQNHKEMEGIMLYRGQLEPWFEEELKLRQEGSRSLEQAIVP
jgi:hypothetical protein